MVGVSGPQVDFRLATYRTRPPFQARWQSSAASSLLDPTSRERVGDFFSVRIEIGHHQYDQSLLAALAEMDGHIAARGQRTVSAAHCHGDAILFRDWTDEVVGRDDQRFFDAMPLDALGQGDYLRVVEIDRAVKLVVFRRRVDVADRNFENSDKSGFRLGCPFWTFSAWTLTGGNGVPTPCIALRRR